MNKLSIRMISFVISMALMLFMPTFVSAQTNEKDTVIDLDAMITEGELYDAVYENLKSYSIYQGEPSFSLFKAYEHYNGNESTPDWVVVEVHSTATATKVYHELFGYYIYCYDPCYDEQTLSYYVIDCETKEVIALTDAMCASKDEYSSFLTDSRYPKITRIGDMNRDNLLDIKDATVIQKCIAEIEDYDTYDDIILGFTEKHHGRWERYISDFDRDGERNIKDATAIQKCIAGLPY